MVSNDKIQRARDSLSRCVKDPSFLDRFYDGFIEKSPEIKRKFENTDFDRQKRVLSDSLFLMLAAAGTTSGYAHVELAKLAKRHSRKELDIHPDLYAIWLDCLMKVVSEVDTEFTPELDEAWRESLAGGIELLKSAY